MWQYRLSKVPQGRPILSASTIYQSTYGGGLHRIAKNFGEFKNWFDPQAVAFLAEWPQGVVVLRTDGRLASIGTLSGPTVGHRRRGRLHPGAG